MITARSCACSRRALLKGGAAASAAAMFGSPSLLQLLVDRRDLSPASRPHLEAARQAERWLARSAQRSERGTAWPWDPSRPGAVQLNLYTGMPGVVLFYLELHRATGEAPPLTVARSAAAYLAASLPNEEPAADAGLYTGLAGTAYTLELTHQAAGDRSFRDASRRALDQLRKSARRAGAGVEWNASTDIISGSAGIGLFLLWAHSRMADAESLELAVQAGKRLIERGLPAQGGTKWLVSPQMARNYPNFSHGTAGVAFFLASLYRATGEASFLDAATSGAAYLDALATTTAGGGRLVFHSEPGNEQIFYLSWCHGPAGTARLFHRLAEVTNRATYRERVAQLARATVDMRVPERSPGFWNNISQCCGNSGVVEFFVDLYRSVKDQRHLEFAERVTADTLQRGTAVEDGMKWVQAEHRVQPELLIAQTGLMQGAAGVGLAMLHLDGAREGRAPLVVLPDNPF